MRTCRVSCGVICRNSSYERHRNKAGPTYKNGQLLKQLADAFDVLVTIDQNIRHQQNLPKYNVGVVAIEIPDTRLVFLRQLLPEIREAITAVKPGELIIIEPRPNSS